MPCNNSILQRAGASLARRSSCSAARFRAPPTSLAPSRALPPVAWWRPGARILVGGSLRGSPPPFVRAGLHSERSPACARPNSPWRAPTSATCRRRSPAPPQARRPPQTWTPRNRPEGTSTPQYLSPARRPAPLPPFPRRFAAPLTSPRAVAVGPPRRRCRPTLGRVRLRRGAGAPSHAEQAPPLPPQRTGRPVRAAPVRQHQYAQPQYAQHAMYPMMYGRSPPRARPTRTCTTRRWRAGGRARDADAGRCTGCRCSSRCR